MLASEQDPADSPQGAFTPEASPLKSMSSDRRSVDRDAMFERASAVIPSGASSDGRSLLRDIIVRTQGAYIWNSEGKRFIDYLLVWGAIVIGHSDRRVNDSVVKAISTCDLNWIGPQGGEVELAEAICEVMPSADKVAFCTSGTDATLHATQLARAATGRRRFLKFYGSFHGWHDQLAVGARFSYVVGEQNPPTFRTMDTPDFAGLHPAVVADTIVAEWNDFEGVRKVFSEYGAELAAVVCEPYIHSYGCVPAAAGFWEELRELCSSNGVLLVSTRSRLAFVIISAATKFFAVLPLMSRPSARR